VLLEKRPYEVKSVQPLPITVSESYTGFDCRAAPHPDRFYADPEAGCEVSSIQFNDEILREKFYTFELKLINLG
jgi:hypothetical protein